jgi:hypothetical protein
MDLGILWYIFGILAFIIPIGTIFWVLKIMRKRQETPRERAERKKHSGVEHQMKDVRETRLEEDDKVSKTKN